MTRESFTAEVAQVAKEQKSLTAEIAKAAEELTSVTAEGAKAAEDYFTYWSARPLPPRPDEFLACRSEGELYDPEVHTEEFLGVLCVLGGEALVFLGALRTLGGGAFDLLGVLGGFAVQLLNDRRVSAFIGG